MEFTMKIMSLLMAALVALTACAPMASACSLPYVDDVNDWGANSKIATVYAVGDKPMKLKAVDAKTRKPAKVRKVKRGVWLVTMKRGHAYKLSVKDKGGKWKSIGYRIY